MLRAGVVAVVLVLMTAAPATAQDRYAYAGGCYAVGGVAGAEQVRMQATALGRYLLYRPDGTYATPAGISATPADWELTPELQARITPATGCAEFPEAPLNATGTPAKGATEFGRVGGADRRSHALDDVRVLRRALPLRQAVGRVRHHLGAARLRGDRRPGRHRGRVPELPQLRQPARRRTTRAATRS